MSNAHASFMSTVLGAEQYVWKSNLLLPDTHCQSFLRAVADANVGAYD